MKRQVIDFKITHMPIVFQKYTFRVFDKKKKNNVMFILSPVPTSKRRKVILKIEENAEENVHVKMFRYGSDM